MVSNSKPSLAIIELYDHFEVVRPLVSLLDCQQFEVTVVLRQQYRQDAEDLSLDGVVWLFVKDDFRSLIFMIRSVLLDHDLVLVTTLAHQFDWWQKLLQGTNYFLLLHNVDPWLRPLNFHFKPWNLLKLLSAMQSLWHRRSRGKLLQNAAAASFLTSDLMARAEMLSGKARWVLPPPIRYYESGAYKPVDKGDRTWILIPATVRKNGRNYEPLWQALANSRQLLPKLQLIFLGASKEREAKGIVGQFRNLEIHGLRVISFDEPMPMTEYDHYFHAADLVVCPFAKEQQIGPYRSRLGRDMCSGVIQDLFRHGKMGVIPIDYLADKMAGTVVQYYDDESDLRQIISSEVSSSRPTTPTDLPSKTAQTLNLTKWIGDLLEPSA